MSEERYTDVLIIGAGMAGGMLARQLRFQFPELKITVIDRKQSFDYWVGESTLCMWGDYAIRICKLGPYLFKNYLMKNGLRYFFDSENHDLPIHEMSEHGRYVLPPLPSFQLDRAKFDMDLCHMNRDIGIDVFLGTRLLGMRDADEVADSLKLDRQNGHVVKTTMGTFRCRYLIDAGGRSSPVARLLKLVPEEPRQQVSSYWARFDNVNLLDWLGPESWRTRIMHPRYLSTNHFMYRGAWFWHIPLSNTLMSIGVCIDNKIMDRKIVGQDQFVSFLKEYRWARDVLGDKYKVVDYMMLKQLPRGAKQLFSTDRWFLTGMSGHFLDPLFSTTSNVTSFINRFIGEMIRADLAGDEKTFAAMTNHFNLFVRLRYEAGINRLKYNRFGSFDNWVGAYSAEKNVVFNAAVPQALEDFKTYVNMVKEHADKGCNCNWDSELTAFSRELPSVINRMSDEYVAFLEQHKAYYARNRGEWHDGRERGSITEKYLSGRRDLAAERTENLRTYREMVRYYLMRMCELAKVPYEDARFESWFDPSWASGQTLAEGFAMFQGAQGGSRTRAELPSVTPQLTADMAIFGEG